ncbi:MAG TPA: metal ABC transporter permease [Anaerolineales bacterium]|nr:metal ABC transporter permease [Anaerolineales bacterium]
MTEVLGYAFMQRALLAGAVIGAVCAIIGVYVVLKGLSFIGAGIAHASFGGVALGFLLGLNPLLTAIGFCLATAWGIGLVARKSQVKEDTAVGIFFASTMALGILFIGLMQGYNVDLFGYLFGSILAVGEQDVWITLGLGAAVLVVVGLFFKELLFVTFDPEMAEVTGVPAGRVYFLLISLVALTVVLSIKVVGIVLVSALIVTPAAAAYQLTEDFRRMMALAVVIGVSSTVGGLLLSYPLNTASGATIVLLATLVFFMAALASPRRWRRPAAHHPVEQP